YLNVRRAAHLLSACCSCQLRGLSSRKLRASADGRRRKASRKNLQTLASAYRGGAAKERLPSRAADFSHARRASRPAPCVRAIVQIQTRARPETTTCGAARAR